MAYNERITRANPGCILFLLDQSFSMTDALAGGGQEKQHALADAVNRLLQNIIANCTREDGVQDYFEIGVLGYRTDLDANPIIEPSLVKALSTQPLIPASQFQEHHEVETRIQKLSDEETGELVEMSVTMPLWVKPKAEGGTPICHALLKCHETLADWIGAHPKSFPPIVINITDGAYGEAGEAADGDPVPYVESITSLATEDGNVLVFNCHLSETAAQPFLFPASDELLPDENARILYKMSSPFPDSFFQKAANEGMAEILQPNARGLAYNADATALVQLLNIGTIQARQLR